MAQRRPAHRRAAAWLLGRASRAGSGHDHLHARDKVLKTSSPWPAVVHMRECMFAGDWNFRDMDAPRFRAIAFDLLTALVDSWSLWIDVAGDEDLGRRWRSTSLQIVTSTGAYQPYELIVRRATAQVGLPPDRAVALLARWGELRPWPEAPDILRRLQGRRLAIVTNCSQSLAEMASQATG